MPKHVDLDPLEPIPAHVIDALNELVGTYVSPNFELRVRAADPTVLEIAAGPGNDQVTAAIGDPADPTKGRWRWISATISRAGLAGAARTLDVHLTAADNIFAAPNPALGEVGEQDRSDHSFALAITEAGALPAGVALSRRIGTATWDGAKFSAVSPLLGKGAAANTTQVVKIVGDGTVGPYDFVHGLGTYDCAVEVYESAAPRATVDVRVERPTVDSVRILPDVPIGAAGAVIVVSSRGKAAGAVPAHGSTHLPGVGTDPTQLPVVTSAAGLAATPLVHGSEVYFLADQAAGVMWHLRCRLWQADGVTPNPSPYKWDVIGGPPLMAKVDTSQPVSTPGSSNPATPGPDVIVPLAGDYDYLLTVSTQNATVTGTTATVGLSVAGVIGGADSVGSSLAANGYFGTPTAQDRKTALAAGTLLRPQYASSSSTAVNFANRRLAVRPVRVG